MSFKTPTSLLRSTTVPGNGGNHSVNHNNNGSGVAAAPATNINPIFEYDGFKATVLNNNNEAPNSPLDPNPPVFSQNNQKNEKEANNGLKPIDTFSLAKHSLIKDRWEVMIKIGQGAFGQTYTALDRTSNEQVAVKVEPLASKKQVLKVEVSLLRKLQDCPYVTRFVGCGRQDDFNFLVMELLGKSVSDLRRKKNDHVFSYSTTALLSHQMLDAIEAVHNHGYLHRDIKPSNFVMGMKKVMDPRVGLRTRCFIIDFGLSRRHLSKDNSVREARDIAGFRGTARYASIAAHLNLELGRKDDIWSLFYIIIEFLTGGLPWRKEKEKEKIGEMKQKCHNPSLVEGLPRCMLDMMTYLSGLSYSDRPQYEYLHTLIGQLFEHSKDPLDVPYDWERSLASGNSSNHGVNANVNTSILKRHLFGSNNNNNNVATMNQSNNNVLQGKSNHDMSSSVGGANDRNAGDISRSIGGNFDATSGFLPVAASSVTHHGGLDSVKYSQDFHSNNLSTTFFSNTTSALGFTSTSGHAPGTGGSQAENKHGPRSSKSGVPIGANISNNSINNGGAVLSRKSSRVGAFTGQLLTSGNNSGFVQGPSIYGGEGGFSGSQEVQMNLDSPNANNSGTRGGVGAASNLASPGFFQKLAEKLHLRPVSPSSSDVMISGAANIPEIRVGAGQIRSPSKRSSDNANIGGYANSNPPNNRPSSNDQQQKQQPSLAKKIEPMSQVSGLGPHSRSQPNIIPQSLVGGDSSSAKIQFGASSNSDHVTVEPHLHTKYLTNVDTMVPLQAHAGNSSSMPADPNHGSARKGSSPSSFLRSFHIFPGTSGKSKSTSAVGPAESVADSEADNNTCPPEEAPSAKDGKSSRGILSRFRKFRKKK